jgi:phosphatidylglycerophosphatase A
MTRDQLLGGIATLGPVGNLPAPGTMGSLIAIITGGAIMITLGIGSLVVFIAGTAILGFPAAAAHHRLTGVKDSGAVIIDEVVGQWLVLLAIPVTPALTGPYAAMLVAAFVLFRFFDIFKMGPVKMAENLPGAAGVMADDVIAGIFAGLVIMIGYTALALAL